MFYWVTFDIVFARKIGCSGGGGVKWEMEEGKAIVGGVNELVGCLAFYWYKKDYDRLPNRFFVKTELELFIVKFEKQIFEYEF